MPTSTRSRSSSLPAIPAEVFGLNKKELVEYGARSPQNRIVAGLEMFRRAAKKVNGS